MKNVVIFGSTGSIGRATLDVIEFHSERFRVLGLAAHTQKDLLIKQIQKFGPRYVIFTSHNEKLPEIKGTVYLYKQEGLEFLATHPETDIVVMGIPGLAGLVSTLKALDTGKTIALATKEIVVCAGHLLGGKKGRILPVDSEHNAIFQIIDREKSSVSGIVLTASGGPFLNYNGDLSRVTVKQVLNHPVWKMGRRITVDSATLMNKGFELIEAFYLFGISKENISVVLHPQAIVHGFVKFSDGFVKAVLSIPDMRYSINYCLNYPERIYAGLPELDIQQMGTLTFQRVEPGMFQCFDLAMEALKLGGSYLTVLNAADEEAVRLFLEGQINFKDIPALIELAMEKHKPVSLENSDDILTLDKQVKKQVMAFFKRRYNLKIN
ncbi:MAG TPA: 1-deoxy-D-xylulose-5-phosphate reductoisomerase [bacterium]|nr:1-deoxy-D-xylulose-5-phosphate reductoisomerase [bacterium]HOL36143.1 1-deoxy-D-xylulose-5-phosphate reductoisomerase [bacterium]HPP07808.1 1-deoxy-D-xylulose-5-phosphate reductoisomerase [bacterium]